jgi:hypothetical protein
MLNDAKDQAVTKRILEIALGAKHEYTCIHPPALANEVQLYYTDVEHKLVRMAEGRLIALSAWDGSRDKPYQEWTDESSFFRNRRDAGYARVRILPDGELFLSRVSKAPIGFAANAS